MSITASILLAVGLVLGVASPGRADIGVIVLEPVGALGYFTRVGHTGAYLSNICPDRSPVRMRLCRPGERGGVVSKYSPFSENEDFDWAIVPLEEYLHGFGSPELAPMIGTPKLQLAIERHNFGPLFSRALTRATNGELPSGQWRAALATRFDRSLYIFTVETTPADDALLVAAFNAAPNRSRFNFFYRNCSNQTKEIFDLILPLIDPIGDRTTGLTMQTPKALAKTLVDRALAHPELNLRVRRFPQIPGTFDRSRDVLFPLENAYKSSAFVPYWFFGGFREFALVAMFYHQVISPFSMLESSKAFMSPGIARLTLEQHHLRQRQDDIGRALTSAVGRGSEWSTLSASNARVYRRLREIRTEQQAEVSRLTGSKAQWRELDREFQTRVRAISRAPFVPDELRRQLVRSEPKGQWSRALLQHFEARADFYADDAGRGPWISLPLADGAMYATGLSGSQILSGDPRVAVLVLAAVLDYNLSQSGARREDIAYVDGLFTMFRQASGTLGRQTVGGGERGSP